MPLPNLIIAGPPKTGTTSLFQWLSVHPDTLPSSIKETDYFNDNIPKNSSLKHFRKDGWEGYETLFPGWKNEKIIFEASPKYIYSQLALSELKKIKDLKILFIHRDESDRLYSEFKFHKYKTKLFNGSLNDYLLHKGIDLSVGVKYESTFSYFVEKWNENFDLSQIKTIDFSSLKKDPQKTMVEVCDFIKINSGFYKDFSFDVKNKTQGIKSRKLHYFLLGFYKYIPSSLKRRLTSLYYSLNNAKIPDATEEDMETLLVLRKQFGNFNN